MSKPSGGIRSLLSLSAWGLPTPVVALACTCSVGSLRCCLCRWSTLFHTAFASWWRGFVKSFVNVSVTQKNPSVSLRLPAPFSREALFPPTKLPRRGIRAASAAVTLPFSHLKLGGKVSGDSPLSLLKRKKEAKKEKSSHSTCTVRFQYHPKITQEILTNKTPPEGHTGGCCRRNTTLFTLEIGG